MQEQQNNLTYKQSNNLFWLAISPLGLLGLPRYFYEGNIGFMRETFLLYFGFGIVGFFGLLHFFQQVTPENSLLLATSLKWALWGSLVMHFGTYLSEVQFFYSLRKNLKTTN